MRTVRNCLIIWQWHNRHAKQEEMKYQGFFCNFEMLHEIVFVKMVAICIHATICDCTISVQSSEDLLTGPTKTIDAMGLIY